MAGKKDEDRKAMEASIEAAEVVTKALRRITKRFLKLGVGPEAAFSAAFQILIGEAVIPNPNSPFVLDGHGHHGGH